MYLPPHSAATIADAVYNIIAHHEPVVQTATAVTAEAAAGGARGACERAGRDVRRHG